jgi:hypothetical protein
MMIARWQIEARFGHKQTVTELLKRWNKEVAVQVGWTAEKVRVLTGSVGALESTVQLEVEIEDLAELGKAWEKLETIKAHKQWSKDIEPSIVSGTPYWQVFRVL